jgi:hypothetical protein
LRRSNVQIMKSDPSNARGLQGDVASAVTGPYTVAMTEVRLQTTVNSESRTILQIIFIIFFILWGNE